MLLLLQVQILILLLLLHLITKAPKHGGAIKVVQMFENMKENIKTGKMKMRFATIYILLNKEDLINQV